MTKKIIFEKIRASETNLEQWKRMADIINVKFSEKSGWYKFKGVENGMFVLAQRNGETFRINQIIVQRYTENILADDKEK